MKVKLAILICLGLVLSLSNAYSEDQILIIKPDSFNKQNSTIYDKDYQKLGSIKADPFNPTKKTIYNERHERIGIIEPGGLMNPGTQKIIIDKRPKSVISY